MSHDSDDAQKIQEILQGQFPEDSAACTLDLPQPTLSLDFRMAVRLNPRITIGQGPWGRRNWISFRDGQWRAKWGSGTVEPGGQDNQLVTTDLSTHLETQYLLRTDDEVPAFITVKTRGWRTGPKDILDALFDPSRASDVSPFSYMFRLYVSLETGDDRYSFVNTLMWLASGARRGDEVIYDAYRVG